MSFIGNDVALEVFGPTLTDPLSARERVTVLNNTAVEFPNIIANQGALTAVQASVDIGSTSFLYTIIETEADSFFDANIDINQFAGIKISDIDGTLDPIVGASIAPGNSLPLSPAEVYYNENEIYVNFAGIDYLPGDQVIIDVEFDASISGTIAPQYVQDVARLYEAAFARIPDNGGLNFWIDQVENGQFGFFDTPIRANPGTQFPTNDQGGLAIPSAIAFLAESFVDSQEFQDIFDFNIFFDSREYVEQLYFNVLDREGDIGGINFWTGLLENDFLEEADVLAAFAVSPENYVGSQYAEDLAFNDASERYILNVDAFDFA